MTTASTTEVNTVNTGNTSSTDERTDLLELLATRRNFLRFTARDLTDEQAASHPTASELCVGGLIKHVTSTEAGWVKFILGGPSGLTGGKSWDEWGEAEWAARAADFQMVQGETLAGLLEAYAEVASETDELVASMADLGATQPLPEAPWFEKGARRSARQVFLHIAAETAQHAGHADIIRETIDGSKTM